jgi:hypothetical protein
MSKPETTRKDPSDEIDLGQVFILIGNGFRRVFRAFLRVFLYFKRNIFWFLGLAILGGIAGFMVNKFGEQKFKQDVIVTPGLLTKNYFYDVVSELQANLEAKDTAFFSGIGIDIGKTPKFKMEITSFRTPEGENKANDSDLIKLLGALGDSEAFTSLLEEELTLKTTRDHRITFFYKNREYGELWAEKILEYINSNSYYRELLRTETKNTTDRILQNDSLVRQIDRLIYEYTEKLQSDNINTEGRLILEGPESLDVPSLLALKNELIANSESKKLELNRKRDVITIVNSSKPYRIVQPLLRKNVVFFPLVFIGLFLLISAIKFLNRKAEQLIERS